MAATLAGLAACSSLSIMLAFMDVASPRPSCCRALGSAPKLSTVEVWVFVCVWLCGAVLRSCLPHVPFSDRHTAWWMPREVLGVAEMRAGSRGQPQS